jgi:hypothetical protein
MLLQESTLKGQPRLDHRHGASPAAGTPANTS